MVTQKDISVVCGVSVAAVSRALNGHGDISASTRRRIVEVAEKMGYVKDRDRDRKGHTFLVGILFTEKNMSDFYNDIIAEIRKLLMDRGYDLVIINPVEIENGTVAKPGYMSRARLLGLEGILVFSSVQEDEFCLSPEQKDLRELVFGEIPVVTVDCSFASCASVRPAYEDGIRELFNYIYSLGHRRIAFLSGKKIANQNILEKEVRAIANEKDRKVLQELFMFYEVQSEQEAAERTEELLGGNRWIPPTCIVYGDDILLKGGLNVIMKRKLQIPEDISLASIAYRQEKAPSVRMLTSWEMSPLQIAQEAVDMIIREIRLPGACSGETRLVSGVLAKGESVRKL